jgi:hypothetical protein
VHREVRDTWQIRKARETRKPPRLRLSSFYYVCLLLLLSITIELNVRCFEGAVNEELGKPAGEKKMSSIQEYMRIRCCMCMYFTSISTMTAVYQTKKRPKKTKKALPCMPLR